MDDASDKVQRLASGDPAQDSIDKSLAALGRSQQSLFDAQQSMARLQQQMSTQQAIVSVSTEMTESTNRFAQKMVEASVQNAKQGADAIKDAV